jgi:hypothetical protein
LLAVARLTPAQAVALGTDVLTALEDRHADGGLCLDAVRVGGDGRAGLIGSGDALTTDGAGLAAAAALLDRIAEATRPSPADPALVLALDRAAAEARSPDGRIASVAAILRDADATDGARARAELGRFVAILAGGEEPMPATRPAARPPTPRRPPRTGARGVVARGWKWILSLVVLVAVVILEIAFLRDEISRDVAAVLEAGRSGTTTSTPTLPPVVPPAPASAGTISRVDLRPIVPCTPDAACALRLHVTLQPRAEPQAITWEFRILDRCTGAAVTAAGGTVTVPPHGDRADAVSTVGLPRADALAVVAVTSGPFTAASGAVNVPATGGCGT